jgi:7-cyano-7-deazaguanine synthase
MIPTIYNRALVVMSGGQDSTTCLGIAIAAAKEVIAVTFDYGQKHAVEIAAAQEICVRHNVAWQSIDVKPILQQMKSSALVSHGDTTQPHPYLPDVPASFVPGRNALFLTTAYAFALEYGCDAIYTGVCQTDFSGYPDCRHEFIAALNRAMNIGYQSSIRIETPLMWATKAETFALAERFGVMEDVLQTSVTCYNGQVETKNEWGVGCGVCPACTLRAKGYATYMTSRAITA